MRLITILLFVCAQSFAATPMDVYEAHKDAALGQDSKAFLSMLTKDSIAYFNEIIRIARFGERAEVEALSYTDKIKVFTIRGNMDHELAKTMTLEQYFSDDLSKNLEMSKQGFAMMKSLRTENHGDGTASIMWPYNNQEHEVLRLQQVDGKWLIDMRSFFAKMDKTIQDTIKMTKMTETEFIKLGLKTLWKKEIDMNKLYTPIGGNNIQATVAAEASPETATPNTKTKQVETKEPETPADDSLGAVTSFTAGPKAVVNLSVGTDLNFQKGDVVYIKRDGKLLTKATLTRLRANKSIAEIQVSDWAEGVEHKLKAGDKVYDK